MFCVLTITHAAIIHRYDWLHCGFIRKEIKCCAFNKTYDTPQNEMKSAGALGEKYRLYNDLFCFYLER